MFETRYFVIILLISASCIAIDFIDADFQSLDDPESSVSNIETFLTSFFLSSGIKANDSLTCFNQEEATAFFKVLTQAYSLQQDISNSEILSISFVFIQFYDSLSEVGNASSCFLNSKDFQQLDMNQQQLKTLKVYYQAQPFQCIQTLQPMITALNNNLYSAAGVAANLWFKSYISLFNENGEDSFNPLAFFNGLFLALKLQLPQSIYQCFNEESALIFNSFITEMENAFNNEVNPISNDLKKYLQGKGGHYLSKMADAISCMNSSIEHQILTAYLGIDPFTNGFIDVIYSAIDNTQGAQNILSKTDYQINGPYQTGAIQYAWLLQRVKSYIAGVKNFESNKNLTGNYENIQTFFNAIWGSFNLTQGVASACFESDPQQLWNYMTYQYYISQNQVNNNESTTQIYQYLLDQVNRSMTYCLYVSNDLTNLAEASGLGKLRTLPFLDRFPQLGIQFGPIFKLLLNSEFEEAGQQYGVIIKNLGLLTSQKYFMFMSGFYNQFFVVLNLDYPAGYDLCYNNSNAEADYEFMMRLAQAGSNPEIVESLTEFWNGKGQSLFSAVQKNWNCEAFNNDIQNVNSAYGTDINGIFFHQLLQSALVSNLTIKDNWESSFKELAGCFKTQSGSAAGTISSLMIELVMDLFTQIEF